MSARHPGPDARVRVRYHAHPDPTPAGARTPMPAPRLLALAGSLRRDSFNKRLVGWAAGLAREQGAEVERLDLKELALPLFDQDDEAEHGLPEGAARLKRAMSAAHGFLIAAPEYNGSITGALKNAIDWASRPSDDAPSPGDCFRGKVVGLLAASPGGLGGLRGLVHVRDVFGNLGSLVLGDQVAVPRAHEALADDGQVTDEKLAAGVQRADPRNGGLLIFFRPQPILQPRALQSV